MFARCVGFWTPATMKDPRAQLAGVQKAPRHEVAGSWALAGQRALWRFDAGADLDDGRDAGPTPSACLPACEVGRPAGGIFRTRSQRSLRGRRSMVGWFEALDDWGENVALTRSQHLSLS